MKTKEFNATKELEKIAKEMSNGETLFAIYVNDKKKELSALTTGDDDNDIICTIAAILETSLTGNGDKGMDRVTHIILEALKLVQTSKSIAGLKCSKVLPRKQDCLTKTTMVLTMMRIAEIANLLKPAI